ncbi:MAG: hypothetical protein ACK40G_13325 [Cytophagaceae bacterium]
MKGLIYISFVFILFSCNRFTIASKADQHGTGTTNEPGTRLDPYPGVDLYEEYRRLDKLPPIPFPEDSAEIKS